MHEPLLGPRVSFNPEGFWPSAMARRRYQRTCRGTEALLRNLSR